MTAEYARVVSYVRRLSVSRALRRNGTAALMVASIASLGWAQDDGATRNWPPDSIDQLPVMTRIVKPYYPDSLRSFEIEGTVVLQAVIDTSGQVRPSSLKVVRSLHPLLDEASVKALRASRFSPARRDGRAVSVIMQIPYTFKIKAVRSKD